MNLQAFNSFPAVVFDEPPRRLLRKAWPVGPSAHEQERYEATIDALLQDRYRIAFEPGCAAGALTARLATRCDAVIAQDIATSAVAAAQRRCGSYKNVRITHGDLLAQAPELVPDLIVFSGIGSCFTAAQLQQLARTLGDALAAGGEFVAVHSLVGSAAGVLHGDQVHQLLDEALPLQRVKSARHRRFRIDTWMQCKTT